jgi:hypothetical protein
MKSTFLKVFTLLLTISTLAVFSGCKKDPDTIATVIVLNEDGMVVPGATVRLFSNPSESPPPPNELRFDTLAVTNGTGKVTFNFTEFYKKGQAGFAVLDIEVTKGNLFGSGIIKIEEKTTTEEAITIE